MHYAPQEQPGAGEEFARWELDLTVQLVRDFLATRSETAGFEAEDLFQECIAHWWQQRPRYEKGRGASPATFLRRVVRARLADIERVRRAEKRGSGQRPASLDAPLPGQDEDGTLADAMPGAVGIEDEVALVLRIRGAFERLSPRQQQIVRGLQSGRSKTEISKSLPLSRQTLYEELARIREVFRDEGLAEFLSRT